jgi:hypothetical protein
MDIQVQHSEKNPFRGMKIVFSPAKKILFAIEKKVFRYRKESFSLPS